MSLLSQAARRCENAQGHVVAVLGHRPVGHRRDALHGRLDGGGVAGRGNHLLQHLGFDRYGVHVELLAQGLDRLTHQRGIACVAGQVGGRAQDHEPLRQPALRLPAQVQQLLGQRRLGLGRLGVIQLIGVPDLPGELLPLGLQGNRQPRRLLLLRWRSRPSSLRGCAEGLGVRAASP